MKILFMSSERISLKLLDVLLRRGDEVLVLSMPDRAVGRGQKLQPNDVSAAALEKGTRLLRPEKLDEAAMATLQGFAPDITFVMAYGRILKEPFIALPRLGTWNLHASLLPELRGASPIETAIATGAPQTGMALMRMVLALDAGPVGAMVKLPILPRTTAPELRELLAEAAAQLVEERWPELEAGTLETLPQQDAFATYCRPFKSDDAFLDPAASAEVLERRVRAFAEKPGAAFVYAGERLKIFEVKVGGETKKAPGTILEAGEKLVVATGKGTSLEILKLQRAGGKRLGVAEFLRGYPMKVGEVLFGRPLRELVDRKPFPRGF